MLHSISLYVLILAIVALAMIAFDAVSICRVLRSQCEEPDTNDLHFFQRTIAWTVPIIALVSFFSLWCALGNYSDGYSALLIFLIVSLISFGFAHMRVLERRFLQLLSGRQAMVFCILRDIILLVVSAIASFYVIEAPWNDLLPNMEISKFVINLCLIGIALVVLYFLGQRSGALVAVGVFLFSMVGVAQYYVALYKGTAILPSDLTGLGTLATVGDTYTFSVPATMLRTISIGLLAIGMLSLMVQTRPSRRYLAVVLGNVCAALLVGILALGGFKLVDFVDDLGLESNYWVSLEPYKAQGFLASFMTLLQSGDIEAPEGYSPSEAEALQEEYADRYDSMRGSTESRISAEAQFSSVRPSVVAIMNESFSDLSIFNGLGIGYPGLTQLSGIDSTLSGTLEVSVYGGGTCNTEFEFLTGGSLAFIGSDKMPYTAFDSSRLQSLPKQFADLGYSTTAIHPMQGTNWNRESVYQEMGFDKFLTIDDFPNAEVFHSGVSDGETYDKVLELLRSSSSPQFIFDVTIQNHGSYSLGYKSETLDGVEGISGVDSDTFAQTDDYLSCIEASERDLVEFINELRALDEPVVVVFFGDHQPGFAGVINDALFPNEDKLQHAWRNYQTPYFIWSNYDLAGASPEQARPIIGAQSLGAVLFDAIGAPMTDFQKASYALLQEVPAYNAFAALDSTGALTELYADDRSQVITDLSYIQYLNIGSKL